jgi:hypothetical protein
MITLTGYFPYGGICCVIGISRKYKEQIALKQLDQRLDQQRGESLNLPLELDVDDGHDRFTQDPDMAASVPLSIKCIASFNYLHHPDHPNYPKCPLTTSGLPGIALSPQLKAAHLGDRQLAFQHNFIDF